jgi:hypothetical protein
MQFTLNFNLSGEINFNVENKPSSIKFSEISSKIDAILSPEEMQLAAKLDWEKIQHDIEAIKIMWNGFKNEMPTIMSTFDKMVVMGKESKQKARMIELENMAIRIKKIHELNETLPDDNKIHTSNYL